ncbi:MAG TPA: alanine racemase [Gemmatimonadaceae bacterium]|nr:alanine racemase [Gemmatimonadaceae bacterium]
MRLEDLPTPCLVLDRGILERNLRRMSDAVHRHGVALRPHLKTAKSADVARLATAGEAGGVTVSTLAEAEYFAEHGFRDIMLANALPPQKLSRAEALAFQGVVVTLVTDDAEMARAIAEHPGRFKVLVEIDSGDRRAGVSPDGDQLVEVATALGDKLAGVMTHAGHSYGCRSIDCVVDVAEGERLAVVTAAARLRDAGLNCEVVSVGSTPTMTHARNLDGVTEARPGVYMFQDLFQAEIGSCEKSDIAMTVLASVIGYNQDASRILIDAGAIALSKDRSTQATQHDAGYGEIRDINNGYAFGKCIVERAYQEHGAATCEPGVVEKVKIGTRVRVAPNHACLTAAAHDRYYIVDGSAEVIDVWDRVNGW